jgi:hypothetical protein
MKQFVSSFSLIYFSIKFSFTNEYSKIIRHFNSEFPSVISTSHPHNSQNFKSEDISRHRIFKSAAL